GLRTEGEIGLAGLGSRCVEAQRGARRVVTGEHAGCGDLRVGTGTWHGTLQQLFNLGTGQGTGTELGDRIAGYAEDGRLDTRFAGAAVEDGHTAMEGAADLFGGGRREPARGV